MKTEVSESVHFWLHWVIPPQISIQTLSSWRELCKEQYSQLLFHFEISWNLNCLTALFIDIEDVPEMK
jgi:hypothetical protein